MQRSAMNLKTKKYHGGDITKTKIFRNILSIGYEIEAGNLTKFTETVDDYGKKVLLNTDTARMDDVKKFQGKEDADPTEDVDDEAMNYTLRQEEELEVPAYNSKGELDTDTSFLVTNDISETKMVKMIGKVCETAILRNKTGEIRTWLKTKGWSEWEDEIIDIIMNSREGRIEHNLEEFFKYELFQNDEDRQKTVEFNEMIETLCQQTDQLYKYKNMDDVDDQYDIHFVFWNTRNCRVFSQVEWIITYFEPGSSENIILETCMNAIRNLLHHLSQYTTSTRGYLALQIENEGGEMQEIALGHPKERRLYSRKGSSTCYMLSNYMTTPTNYPADLTLYDTCVTMQMTFSAEIQHIFPIMKRMIYSRTDIVSSTHKLFEDRFNVLLKIESCVDALLASFNLMYPEYKIEKEKVEKSRKNVLYSSIKNYIGLILYKLSIYVNKYLQQDPTKKMGYLKDKLFFNCRHSNYTLYEGLKTTMVEYFSRNFSSGRKTMKRTSSIKTKNNIVIKMIKDLFVNDFVLSNPAYFLDEGIVLPVNVFSSVRLLKQKDAEYGNPAVSLLSYFEFFEHPTDEEDNVGPDNLPRYRDWLEYNMIDSYSSKMDIQMHEGKKTKILVEYRAFQRALIPYMLSIAKEPLKRDMREGICNKLIDKMTEDISITSIRNLGKMLRYYEQLKSRSATKTKKAKN
jgi:hypothetical protein